jgi:hypothetical protein
LGRALPMFESVGGHGADCAIVRPVRPYRQESPAPANPLTLPSPPTRGRGKGEGVGIAPALGLRAGRCRPRCIADRFRVGDPQ